MAHFMDVAGFFVGDHVPVKGVYDTIMGNLRVLLANEPRSYRETLAATLRALRPNAEVLAAEPKTLDGEIESFAPELVICSNLTAAVENGVLAWVELYPGHGPLATVSVDGERSTREGIELHDLLSVVDRVALLTNEG